MSLDELLAERERLKKLAGEKKDEDASRHKELKKEIDKINRRIADIEQEIANE